MVHPIPVGTGVPVGVPVEGRGVGAGVDGTGVAVGGGVQQLVASRNNTYTDPDKDPESSSPHAPTTKSFIPSPSMSARVVEHPKKSEPPRL